MTRYAIEGARVFDGDRLIGVRTVEIDGPRIVAVGGQASPDAERVDGWGATLLPGLIDSHTHADVETLGHALQFGVTTEFDLFSFPQKMIEVRHAAAQRHDIADARSASVGMTAPGGHPTQLRGNQDDPELPTVGRPQDTARFVEERIAEGADYVKVLIESGKTLGKDVPVVDERIVKAAVTAAHERDRMVIAHALTIDATWKALAAGVDGFAHLFVDGPHNPGLIEALVNTTCS
jgi:imidazolonepropionase-like amidohydrolase